ncbi:MAG: ADP-ribosyl-[dinitrogen reductase] hydrolase [Azonexus sp.]|nr:ADP-ribosyl-[dinitrogen reductase] hydrolase [Betaproteobacteria bacterium]MBK8919111.1 ADP-ribosyl-[dinitrogen reductase] hydrolase [Betaproteobacteria bacterium]MBP6036567.1 ADP-ribosyl-[dinitrogen reductase] hydrolase [Azonexus sp.]MBP6907175.1 ADP-ribosyl-[dinitrogen reductase] hydrolase [Azonexus sp.]
MLWARELIARPAPVHRRASPDRSALVERATAAYLGLAIGDALGATVEFLTPREILQQYGTHQDITGGGWLRLKPGQVTDDTTMSLALGDAILATGRVEARAAAEAFDAWMRAKPVDIGNTVRRNLITFRKTGNPEAPPSEHDAGNGAAMRVLPAALATFGHGPEATAAACRAQGHVTHHNALSDAASIALAGMVQDFMNGLPDDDVERRHCLPLIAAHPCFTYTSKPRENPSGFVVETLQAVLQSLFATESFEDCLIDVVNRGGDADTTGAIAGMLAGARYGLEAIPPRWLRKLEPAIRERCAEQARKLVTTAASRTGKYPESAINLG